MLYQESKGRGHAPRPSSEQNNAAVSFFSRCAEILTDAFYQVEATKEALQRNPDYKKYIENLQSTEYFKGELKGSALWNDLENKAAATFVEVRRTE